MNVEQLIEFLEEIKERHGDVDVRAVEPQFRTTPELSLAGGFIDEGGVVLVIRQSGAYFSTDQDDAYDGAQFGDFYTELD